MNKIWLKSPDDMLKSLLVDEAKNKAILDELIQTINQLRAKSAFRLALINQLIENKELINEYNDRRNIKGIDDL